MIKLNDYLYSGSTIPRILRSYRDDLRESALLTLNPIDLVHCNFLLQISELLEHNDFLTSQSQRIREFYKYMAERYPDLSFTFKGRIKSLIRAETKFNAYICEAVSRRYTADGTLPTIAELKDRLSLFRDLIAYRVVISVPRYFLKPGETAEESELNYLYEIANILPDFLEARGFTSETSGFKARGTSPRLREDVRPYYRDYCAFPSANGYRSLHITFYDNIARCYIEVQLRTKSMDDEAEIGSADHFGYEQRQKSERSSRGLLPEGLSPLYDEAWERMNALQQLDLSKVDVNMFSAADDYRVNDGCGLYRGRLILPYEHLSRFQNDLID